jgi:DNA-binding MarR family transcriptional regulator
MRSQQQKSYLDTAQERLQRTFSTPDEQDMAIQILTLILRHIDHETYVCEKIAAELSDLRVLSRSKMSQILMLLEQIGAIERLQSGRSKVIVVDPSFGAERQETARATAT